MQKIPFEFVFCWWKNKCMGDITPIFTVQFPFFYSTFRVETIPSASGFPLHITKDGLSWCCNNKQLPCLRGLTHKNFFYGPGDTRLAFFTVLTASVCWPHWLKTRTPRSLWWGRKSLEITQGFHPKTGCISSTTWISFIRDLAKKLRSTVTCV